MFKAIKLLSMFLLFITNVCFASELVTLEGQKINFSSLQGKWVFINYWASWCNPCLDEIPELNHFYEKNKDKIALFAVNYDAQSVSERRHLTKKFAIGYPGLAIDPAQQLKLGDIRGVPATFVFNPQGKLVDVLYGPQTQATLKKVITS